MTLLKDLINIPERVHQGDFVLKLSEGVIHAEQTLRDYVVTPQLVDAFSNALGFIEQAVRTGSSKAAYLHGSFGSGKSHFMAVLNLLLAGNTQARSTPELADVVARNGWTHGRKFLLVPYHMVGARDMESAILGHYAEFVRVKHPEAPVPGFYLAEGMFKAAKELRQRMGDAAFFAKLNEGAAGGGGSGGNSGWGDFAAGWQAASFEAAMLEAPNGEERSRLVGDLIGQFFSAYRTLAGSGESFVSLDDGLSIMSRHARDLGYDAVILFLDELAFEQCCPVVRRPPSRCLNVPEPHSSCSGMSCAFRPVRISSCPGPKAQRCVPGHSQALGQIARTPDMRQSRAERYGSTP